MSGLTISKPAKAAPAVAQPVMLPVTLRVNGYPITLDKLIEQLPAVA